MEIQIRKAEIKDAGKICGISCNDLGYECDDLLIKSRLENISPDREAVFVAESDGAHEFYRSVSFDSEKEQLRFIKNL